MTSSVTVLIIGAGPVGLTLAVELTRYGIPVRIVDKAPQRTDKSKALVLWSRTLELLDRQPGGSAAFDAAGFHATAVSFLSDGKLVGRIGLETVDSPYRYALMIPQSETERVLEERLESLGVRVQRATEVSQLSMREDGADAVLGAPGQAQETVSADWVVGCDGAHSLVRHTVKAPFIGKAMDSEWVLADVHMSGYPAPDAEATIYWNADGAFIIFPIRPGRYRLVADVPPSGGDHPLTPTLAQIRTIIERRGPRGMSAFDPIWLSGFRINARKVSSYRWGRAFLCGDAAQIHSPAGGHGMNTGMQDAFNLAWKLALAAKGRGSESLLDSYSAERSNVGDLVMRDAQNLTRIATTRSPVARTLRDVAGHLVMGLAPIQHKLADKMADISVGYPSSPLNSGSASGLHGPAPGQRCVSDRPFGAEAEPRFALMAAGGAAAGLIARHSERFESALRLPPDPHGVWLVRPDGYIAAVAKAGDLSIIEKLMDGLNG